MTLRYVPLPELERLRSLDADPVERAACFADACRLNALYMIERAGSGHPGTTFSSLDIVTWLHLEVLRPEDRYFSSKGHDAPGLYAVLAALGELDFDRIHALRRLGGLPGHPDVAFTPEVVTSTGSLGMGVSKARGFVLADRILGREGRVFVLTGDGELQEGQFWESLQPTANRALREVTVVVDRNEVQSDTWVDQVSDLGDLRAKVEAFGWTATECDGNDMASFRDALAALEDAPGPRVVIAHTRKGAGVSFMEPAGRLPRTDTALYGYHSGAPGPEEYELAVEEIRARLDDRLAAVGEAPVELVEAAPPEHVSAEGQVRQRLVAAYGEALLEAAEREPRLVALDADLRYDCGLVEFRERFPDRFFECGIAEQDMVSQAGAMALAGLLPVVHSFACFLSTRPNEQIYNNATEGTKVIYVGSLAGLVPGGPGHSHQSVRDISALGAVPGMTLLEPCSEAETRACVRWAVEEATGPVYLRLVSVRWALGFEPPEIEELQPGRGTVLRAGEDIVFVAAGPVMVAAAWAAAELLAEEEIWATVISLPWLRDVDGVWLKGMAGRAPIFCLDNHYVDGGQGDAVLAAVAGTKSPWVQKIGVREVPKSGENNEVLAAHGLDAESIAAAVLTAPPIRDLRTRASGFHGYYGVLDLLHARLEPSTYVEIGVDRGRSLVRAHLDSTVIGIDPQPKIDTILPASVRIFQLPSDEFFASHDLRAELGGRAVDLAFIDGAHSFEQALRDFIHLEPFCEKHSVIAIHDCYFTGLREREVLSDPKNAGFWSYPWKLVLCLREFRPDLRVSVVECAPTGLAVVTGLDPHSERLAQCYDDILQRYAAVGYDTVAADKHEKLNIVRGDRDTVVSLLPAVRAHGADVDAAT